MDWREVAGELFDYHAVDGALDERSFSQLLQEGMAYSFVEPGCITNQLKGDLRCAVARVSLPGIGSPLFSGVFAFFDIQGKGLVQREQLLAGLEQFLTGSWPQKLQFLFFVTDRNQDGLLTPDEMEQFLQHFRSFYYQMARSVLIARRAKRHADTAGLDERIGLVEEQLGCQPRMVSQQCRDRLAQLDADQDGHVSASEWAAAEFVLPVQYGVLLACLVGIADQSRAGQFFHNLVIDEPEPEPEPEPVEPEPVVEVRKPFTIDDLRKHQSIKGLLQMDTPAGVC